MDGKLWNRNYSIIVIGQALSLFANNILYFAISLYILDLTSSGTIYGTITAFSIVPLLLLLPVGGVFTDRYNKKKILITTDLCTAALVALFGFGIVAASSLLCVILLLMSLTVIEGFYTPCTQAMIPAVQTEKNLVRANAIVNQIATVANILGPVIGGLLYGFTGLRIILVVSMAALFGSALLELFIQWPRTEGKSAEQSEGISKGFWDEFKEGAFFIRDNRKIHRMLTLTAVINLTLTGLFTVGMAFMIKLVLMYSGEVYGIASTCGIIAGLLGSFLAGMLGEKLQGKMVYRFLIGSCVCLLPISLGFWLHLPRLAMLILIIAMFMIEMCLLSAYSVYSLSLIQRQTPEQKMGKVMSLVVMIAICTDPIGRVVYGVAFDHIHSSWLVLLTVVAVVVVVLYFQKKLHIFEGVEKEKNDNV